MKKFFFALCALVAFATTSCSTEETVKPKTEQTTDALAKHEADGDIMLVQAKNQFVADHPGVVVTTNKVNCHTNYAASIGHACVTVNGYQYQVNWSDIDDGFGDVWTSYTTVPKANCKC